MHEVGSNLALKTNNNSVIKSNSVHRLSYTADDLLLASRRGRGRLRHRAGAVKTMAWLLLVSKPSYLA